MYISLKRKKQGEQLNKFFKSMVMNQLTETLKLSALLNKVDVQL